MATTLAGSRPIVASPSGSGMVWSFEGPAVTNSLGRNQVSKSFVQGTSITARPEMHDPSSGFSISEQLVGLSLWIVLSTLDSFPVFRLPKGTCCC
jgi:hypothetical protein